MDILETLVQKNIITADDVPRIQEEAEKTGATIEQVLLKRGVQSTDLLAALGEYLDVPVREIGESDVPSEVLKYIPEQSAEHYKIVPIGLSEGVLEIGMVDPEDIEARDIINFLSTKLKKPFKIFLISQADFEHVLGLYKGFTSEVSKALDELGGTEGIETIPDKGEKEESLSGENSEGVEEDMAEDAPVVKMVNTILRYAIDGSASDIHIEPWRENLKVRFRVDGTMNTSLVLPIKVHPAVVARIKILSNMRLDEKRKPQDGRFSAKIENRKIDFRVSTFPTYFGEKVVMRILDQEKGVKPLDQLGLTQRNLDMMRRAINRPYGLILISGPTGSGKTTTLYSMLSEIDKEHQNVLSLEDPVEYNIEGISQSQVRSDIGYTFASGLRTTLRQDPDVIMVGEIRDKETAQLAIQAALTGHLVLSTIHTNSATGVVPRLIDMGIDPYLIAPTLVLACAQRLVAGLCPGAGKPFPVEGGIKVMVDKQFEDLPEEYRSTLPLSDTMYELAPSSDCPNGTRGRLMVAEIFEMDRELESIILKNPNEPDIFKYVRGKGMLTMKEDAILKAMNKEIPFEEVNSL